MPKIRVFVDAPLAEGQVIPLDRDQSHYLVTVMRRSEGDRFSVFNGRDGEWEVALTAAHKKNAQIQCRAQIRPQAPLTDIWLLFAPIRKTRLEILVEKATELGTARLCPVLTDHTDAPTPRLDRLATIAREATEQSRGLALTEVAAPEKLDRVLADWPADRHLLVADETQAGRFTTDAFAKPAPAAILIGPEGGFSVREQAMMSELPVTRVALGPRILRAETAAIAALTLWLAAQC